VIGAHDSTAEVSLKSMKNLDIPLVLNDREFRQHLITYFHIGMSINRDMEAALPIHKANYPLRFKIHLCPSLQCCILDGY